MPVIASLGSLHQQSIVGILKYSGNWIAQVNGAGSSFSYFDSTANEYWIGNPVAKISTDGIIKAAIVYNSGYTYPAGVSNIGTFAQVTGAGGGGNVNATNKANFINLFKSPNVGVQLSHYQSGYTSGLIGGPNSVVSQTANIAYVSGAAQVRALQPQRSGYVIKVTDTAISWETDFYPANGNAAITAAMDVTTMTLCNGVPIAAGSFSATYTSNYVVIDNAFMAALNATTGAATWIKAYVSGTTKIYPSAPVQIGTNFFASASNYLMMGVPSTGAISASRTINGTITGIYPDPTSTSNMYIRVGLNNFIKMTTGFVILYQRRFTDAGNIGITNIVGDTGSNIFISSGNVVMKVPSDGSIPGTGSYNIAGNAYSYSNINTTYSLVTSNVASANSLISTTSGFSPGYTALSQGVTQPSNVNMTLSIITI